MKFQGAKDKKEAHEQQSRQPGPAYQSCAYQREIVPFVHRLK